MSYTFTGINTATGSVNPAQQSPAGGGSFQLPPWLTGLFTPGGPVANAGAAAANFLATDAGACWQAYPPFSGAKEARAECLRRVATGQPYAVQVNTSGQVNSASIANFAAIGIAGFIAYQLLKK